MIFIDESAFLLRQIQWLLPRKISLQSAVLIHNSSHFKYHPPLPSLTSSSLFSKRAVPLLYKNRTN